MEIGISRAHFPVTTLGPGRRVGIWLQGCSIRCAGCISADTWGFDRGLTTVDALLTQIRPWLRLADGVTISGGEPFDQPDALFSLLRLLALRPEQSVLVFSGYPIERLQDALTHMDGLIDALVSDPFEAATPQTLALRGSDNQRLHLLTKKGRHQFEAFERVLDENARMLDVMFDADGVVWLAGIPRQGDMRRLEEAMRVQGHAIQTSEAVRATP